MSEFNALVPAAGFGRRMGNELPKQYLPLAGQPMIFHALNTLCASPEIATVFVVLSPGDTLFRSYDWSRLGGKLQPLFCGGAERPPGGRDRPLAPGVGAAQVGPGG